MNRVHGTLALVALAAAGIAAAQTPSQSMTPQQTSPRSQYPTETNPPASSSQSDTQSAKDAKKQQMKDCMRNKSPTIRGSRRRK